MHISYKPLWHMLIERNMKKEDLGLAAGLTTNMIANMGKEGKHISMDTLQQFLFIRKIEIRRSVMKLLTKQEIIAAIEEITDCRNKSEQEIDRLIDKLEEGVPDPQISDYILERNDTGRNSRYSITV